MADAPSAWYSLHLFNRQGTCLYHRDWTQEGEKEGATGPLDDKKMIYGLLFSLKSFVSALEPIERRTQGKDRSESTGTTSSFRSFRTNTYKLHYLESPTGVRIVLVTDPTAGDYGDTLRYIYRAIYLEYAVKNPLYEIGTPVDCPYFVAALEKYAHAMMGVR
eukprot:jgi/Pico_ML_1/52168/g377.t1